MPISDFTNPPPILPNLLPNLPRIPSRIKRIFSPHSTQFLLSFSMYSSFWIPWWNFTFLFFHSHLFLFQFPYESLSVMLCSPLSSKGQYSSSSTSYYNYLYSPPNLLFTGLFSQGNQLSSADQLRAHLCNDSMNFVCPALTFVPLNQSPFPLGRIFCNFRWLSSWNLSSTANTRTYWSSNLACILIQTEKHSPPFIYSSLIRANFQEVWQLVCQSVNTMPLGNYCNQFFPAVSTRLWSRCHSGVQSTLCQAWMVVCLIRCFRRGMWFHAQNSSPVALVKSFSSTYPFSGSLKFIKKEIMLRCPGVLV